MVACQGAIVVGLELLNLSRNIRSISTKAIIAPYRPSGTNTNKMIQLAMIKHNTESCCLLVKAEVCNNEVGVHQKKNLRTSLAEQPLLEIPQPALCWLMLAHFQIFGPQTSRKAKPRQWQKGEFQLQVSPCPAAAPDTSRAQLRKSLPYQ